MESAVRVDHHFDGNLGQRHSVFILRVTRDRVSVFILDGDFGVAEIERDFSLVVTADRYRRGGEKLGNLDIAGKIQTRSVRQGFDDCPV